jgi:hypothetical protein
MFSPTKGKFAIRILTARAESQGDRPVQSNQELPLNAKRQRLSTKKFRETGDCPILPSRHSGTESYTSTGESLVERHWGLHPPQVPINSSNPPKCAHKLYGLPNYGHRQHLCQPLGERLHGYQKCNMHHRRQYAQATTSGTSGRTS